MAEQQPQQRPPFVHLTPAELGLYRSGVKQGQKEGVLEAAQNLTNAATHYRADIDRRLEAGDLTAEQAELVGNWIAVLDSLAEQLTEGAGKAAAEAKHLLERAIADLPDRRPRLSRRLKRAMMGLVEGWKSEV